MMTAGERDFCFEFCKKEIKWNFWEEFITRCWQVALEEVTAQQLADVEWERHISHFSISEVFNLKELWKDTQASRGWKLFRLIRKMALQIVDRTLRSISFSVMSCTFISVDSSIGKNAAFGWTIIRQKKWLIGVIYGLAA